jgi:hypothetical protein
VDIIAVHASNSSREKVSRFIDDLSAAPSVVVCGSNAVKEDFQFRGFPHTILVGHDGPIVDPFMGYTSDNLKHMETRLKGF